MNPNDTLHAMSDASLEQLLRSDAQQYRAAPAFVDNVMAALPPGPPAAPALVGWRWLPSGLGALAAAAVAASLANGQAAFEAASYLLAGFAAAQPLSAEAAALLIAAGVSAGVLGSRALKGR